MKTKELLLTIFMVFLMPLSALANDYRYIQVALPATSSVLGIDADGYYLIASAEAWKMFASMAAETPDINGRLTTDIDLGDDQTMIGASIPYKGAFDGQGHTLKINYLMDRSAVAPFSKVEGATIENLHVTGKMETAVHAVGGIVAEVLDNEKPTIIRNCWSSSQMTARGNFYYGTIGGIVSENHGILIIEDCLFDGRFADSNTYYNGGIVANTWRDLTIRNTLNAGSYPPQSTSGTFYRTDSQSGAVNLENVYYKNVCGVPQGTQVSDNQLADGSVTALLQHGRSETIWIQGNSTPVLSFNGTTIVDRPSVSITTDKQLYVPGETVKISGTAANMGDTEWEVYVVNDGVKQTFKTTADANGAFSVEWMPVSGQMGHYTIGAASQGVDLTEQPAEVDIIGLRRTSNDYITCETAVGDPFEGLIEVENPCMLAQQLTDVEVLGKPENCEVTIEKSATIGAGGRAAIKYTLTGSQPSAGRNWEEIRLRIATEEGARLDATLYYYCHSQKPVLVAAESSINTTMTKDSERDYLLRIANEGKGATGRIWLSMPGVAWLTSVTPTELPSLGYGETATIVLRLKSTDAVPLNVPQTGTIGVNCENGDGLAINYSIEAVSEEKGTLVVDVLDEFSLDDGTGPHVSGAAVEVMHPTTGEVIAQGTTADDGTFSTELPEGYYSLSVTAEKHSAYKNNVLVDPGRETQHEAFISYEALHATWTMEETAIKDEYEITITPTFETNVPKPVLVITLPEKKPVPGEVFPVKVNNHGLIQAEHVSLSTAITAGFEFEVLGGGLLDVLGAKDSVTYYCVIKDKDGLWDSSCIDAYVVAEGYYQCRGMQSLQTRADIYVCTRSGSTTGNSGGGWPGASGPGGPSFDGGTTVAGSATGGTTPWISWPCNTCQARVKLEIKQDLTLSRPAYRGTLTLENGHETTAATDVRLNLTITDAEGKTAGEEEFAITIESLDTFTGEQQLPGGWTLGARQTGKATVLFIPTPQAAPDGPKAYTFGGTMSCIDPFSGQQLTLPLNATTFTVQPLPDLELTYLMQRDVYGDDPLTEGVVEPSVPAEFALIINNKGNGDAENVRIVTEQPRIVENESGLLIDFSIDSTLVNGQPAWLHLSKDQANEFGTIGAHRQGYAQWWLRSSLLGHFISYDISVNHVTSYGNADLSLVSTATIHEMTHGFTPMFNLQSSMFNVKRAWLVNDTEDGSDLPDAVYFANATQQPLYIAMATTTALGNSSYQLAVRSSQAGWGYGSVTDPTGGRLKVARVTRQSDGAAVPLDNVWQTDRTLTDSRKWTYEHRLHFVASLPEGGDTFIIDFEPQGEPQKIEGVVDKAVDKAIYDLQGRRVRSSQSTVHSPQFTVYSSLFTVAEGHLRAKRTEDNH